jgi:2-dehydro-3-deoxygluconokinase
MTVDIVALGEPLFELNQQADGRFQPGCGGDTSNVAIAARRLGASTAYVTRLGADSFGDTILETWRRERVDASQVKRDGSAPTGLYLITHDGGGHRFSYCRAGSAASLMTPADLPEALIASAKYLHVSGLSQAISVGAAETVTQAVAMAVGAGVRVSYDTNFRQRLWPVERAQAGLRIAAVHADILKTSLDDARALSGLTEPDAIADWGFALGARAVVVTLGADGVVVATPDRRLRLAGHAVETVDATGAGDAFTGALLAELCRGRALFAAAGFANAAAALSTQGYGALGALPRRGEVEAFLQGTPAAP